MFGILEAVSVPYTGIYPTYEDLIRDLNDRVTKEGYKIVKARSHRARIAGSDISSNEMVRCDLVCDRGGRPYVSQATKHKTSTKKTGCPWSAKAVNRKTMGGWVLTINCDQHNHAPGTPEPPTPSQGSENEDNGAEDVDDDEEGPRPDPDTSAALQVAGVSNAVLRLTGDTFHQFKTDYRKMSQPERLGILSQLQLRIAAIYAVQNEDVQRSKRHEAAQKRHNEIEANRRQRLQQKRTQRQQQQQQQQVGTPDQAHMQPQQQMPPQQHPHHLPQPNQGQQQHHLPQQQFQLPDSPSQQLMAIPGMELGIPQQSPQPQQPQQPQYPEPNQQRIRGSRQS